MSASAFNENPPGIPVCREYQDHTEKAARCSSFSWKITSVALLALACLAVCFVGVAAAFGVNGLPSSLLSQKAYIPMIVGGVVYSLGLLYLACKMDRSKQHSINPEIEASKRELEEWVRASAPGENRAEAKRRILNAWQNRSNSLSLSELNLTSLPKMLKHLTALKMLYLDRNQLQSVPSEISSLTALEWLYLNHNQLQSLPPEIGSLTALKELFLDHNQLQSVPPEIGSLTALKWLSLDHNQLQSVPPEIGSLTALQRLSLDHNQLQSVPPEIGSLIALKHLYLNHNQLQSVPSEIGSLTALKQLFLYHNQLQSVPSEIGSLTALEELSLDYNQLQSVPSEIGSLIALKHLYLHYNQLQSVPSEIGSLTALQRLSLDYNSGLSELPVSLGNISGLTYIGVEGTRISRELRDAILRIPQARRASQALSILPEQLRLWSQYAGIHFPQIASLPGSLRENEKQTLSEWLTRLSRTRDFEQDQAALAKTVCHMLKDIPGNKEFRELFFLQAEQNNENCEDRASMALNELFVSWKILLAPASLPLKNHLELLLAAGKTLALWEYLSQKIHQRQQEQGALEHESVQIYLYYQISLTNELGLLTAVYSMRYGRIGQRDWIVIPELKSYVQEHCLKQAVSIPIFDKLFAKDPKAQRKQEEIDQKYAHLLEVAETRDEASYLQAAEQYKAARQQELNEYKMAWFLNKL